MTENEYKNLPDVGFRTQYDVTPRDADVERLLAGIEPDLSQPAPRQESPRIKIEMPSPQFTWLKPLR